MTPEQLLQRIEKLEGEINKLKASSTIPYEVEQALRQRLAISTYTPLSVSSAKGADTEDVAIDEGGIATHTVMADPTGFLQVTIASTVYYIPYFS